MISYLEPVSGNYPGCIAEALLENGQLHGRTGRLVEKLEQVTKICPDKEVDGGMCLLAPVVASLGIVSLHFMNGHHLFEQHIAAANHVTYPSRLREIEIQGTVSVPEGFESKIITTCVTTSPSPHSGTNTPIDATINTITLCAS